MVAPEQQGADLACQLGVGLELQLLLHEVVIRLRALEALYPHAERATVRAGVLAALPREQNPLVLLELIDFVATAHEDDAAPFLERLSSDESTNTLVRDAARLALTQF